MKEHTILKFPGLFLTVLFAAISCARQQDDSLNAILLLLAAGPSVDCSDDGQTWTAHPATHQSDWFDIIYAEGKYVAVAAGGDTRLMTSADGITWKAGSVPASSWRSIGHGNGRFVAVASTGLAERVITSTDGRAWTEIVPPATSQWRDVVYGQDRFVAIAPGLTDAIIYSLDGINWSATNLPFPNAWKGIAYGKGLFAAVSSDGSAEQIVTSADGAAWTKRMQPENGFRRIKFLFDKFIGTSVVAANRTMISNDGISWESGPQEAEENTWEDMVYGGGLYVAVAGDGTNRIMTSTDGMNWTARSAPEQNAWRAVTYGDGQFVAVASDGENRVMVSACD